MKDFERRAVIGSFELRKKRQLRISQICGELVKLWSNFSFPCPGYQMIVSKVKKLLDRHEKNRKRKKSKFETALTTQYIKW
jgi:hypothetical protein